MLASIFLASSLVSGLAGSSMVAAQAATPATAPDLSAPTALEQALIEHACVGVAPIGSPGHDAIGQCLDARLATLRAEFGRNLGRLSVAERKKLDSACSRFETTEARDRYLDCIHAELTSLSSRRPRANVAVAPAAAPVVEPAAAPPPAGDAASPVPFPLRPAGMALIATLAAAVVALFVVRVRLSRHACHTCGVRISNPGDLCPACRHNAAETLRRAAAERDDRQRAQDDEERRQRDQAETLRYQQELVEEETRIRRREEARLSAEAWQREEAARQREEEEDRRQIEEFQYGQAAGADNTRAAFDPHATLGVPKNASDEQIRAAFDAARTKYDPEQVAHLGPEVQEHYTAKSQAAERAYRMLAHDADAPPAEPAAAPAPAYSLTRFPAT